MSSSCYILFISIIFSPFVSGLYFHIGETERKCFIEEIPDETTVLGNIYIFVLFFIINALIITFLFLFLVNYKVELHDPRTGGFMPSGPGIGMHVEVKDPDMKTILSRVCYKPYK